MTEHAQHAAHQTAPALLALLALLPLNRGAPYACLTLDHLQLLGVQAVRGQERKVPVGGTTVTVSVESLVNLSFVSQWYVFF